MDDIYRGFRISVSADGDGWRCRIASVRGTVAPFEVCSEPGEAEETCFDRACRRIDDYLRFLGPGSG